MSRAFILGLTGSIGMGKTTTANIFSEFGVPVWNADAVVHELYSSDKVAIEKISKLAPDATARGFVDRNLLQKALIERPELLKSIEAVIHPLVAADRAKFLKENAEKTLVVLDIPLIYEKNNEDLCDAILVVSVDENTQKERVLSREGMTAERFEYILSRQVPDAEKRKNADFVIETKSIDQTRRDVQKLLEEIRGSAK